MRLQEILLFRELDIPLKHISGLLEADKVTKQALLSQQLEILRLKREHLDQIIVLTQDLIKGENTMSLTTFNQEELTALQAEAKDRWDNTDAYKVFSKKNSSDNFAASSEKLMSVFRGFVPLMDLELKDERIQEQVKTLQNLISQEFYPCTNEVLAGLGQLYASDSRFTQNIDQHAVQGVSNFVSQAIAAYVTK